MGPIVKAVTESVHAELDSIWSYYYDRSENVEASSFTYDWYKTIKPEDRDSTMMENCIKFNVRTALWMRGHEHE